MTEIGKAGDSGQSQLRGREGTGVCNEQITCLLCAGSIFFEKPFGSPKPVLMPESKFTYTIADQCYRFINVVGDQEEVHVLG